MTTTLTKRAAETYHSADEQAIEQIVERFVAAWNDGDSAGIAALFTEDADFINILGIHDRGRAAIGAGHRYIFDTVYRGSRNRYTVEDIRFLRPDVAVAFIRAHLTYYPTDEAGEVHASPTMVLTKDDGEWRIVAFQNTKIATSMARSGADL